MPGYPGYPGKNIFVGYTQKKIIFLGYTQEKNNFFRVYPGKNFYSVSTPGKKFPFGKSFHLSIIFPQFFPDYFSSQVRRVFRSFEGLHSTIASHPLIVYKTSQVFSSMKKYEESEKKIPQEKFIARTIQF